MPGRIVRRGAALGLGAVWWWAVLRLTLSSDAGVVEGAVAASGWGLSLLPVHCVPKGRSGVRERERERERDRRVARVRSGAWVRDETRVRSGARVRDGARPGAEEDAAVRKRAS
ncbi:hypothetical protein [Streptomyces sp. CRN 30]|uniref:hypothetical protein n=1 Tax=Streptomyces sp. CRN 30 TaxID=3075613 RepID=UPI002A84027B|nr:hypothetical protein [Streptomyces sp. CRN 30]